MNYAPPRFFDIVGGSFEPNDTQSSLVIYQYENHSIIVYYNDTWHNLPITNPTISVNNTCPDIVEVISALPDQTHTGYYIVTIYGKTWGSTRINVTLSKLGYDSQSFATEVTVLYVEGPPPPPWLRWLPTLVVIFCAILFNEVYWKKRKLKQQLSETPAAESFEALTETKNEESVNEDNK